MGRVTGGMGGRPMHGMGGRAPFTLGGNASATTGGRATQGGKATGDVGGRMRMGGRPRRLEVSTPRSSRAVAPELHNTSTTTHNAAAAAADWCVIFMLSNTEHSSVVAALCEQQRISRRMEVEGHRSVSLDLAGQLINCLGKASDHMAGLEWVWNDEWVRNGSPPGEYIVAAPPCCQQMRRTSVASSWFQAAFLVLVGIILVGSLLIRWEKHGCQIKRTETALILMLQAEFAHNVWRYLGNSSSAKPQGLEVRQVLSQIL